MKQTCQILTVAKSSNGCIGIHYIILFFSMFETFIIKGKVIKKKIIGQVGKVFFLTTINSWTDIHPNRSLKNPGVWNYKHLLKIIAPWYINFIFQIHSMMVFCAAIILHLNKVLQERIKWKRNIIIMSKIKFQYNFWRQIWIHCL